MTELDDILTGQRGGGQNVEMGTVGWEDDDNIFDQGTEDNDGYTFVKVQLFRGRDVTKPKKPGIGQGHKLSCHLSSQILRIPRKGTRCYVALPSGFENVVGIGVIFATVEKAPLLQQIGNMEPGDQVIGNYGADGQAQARMVLKANGTIVWMTTDDNTPTGNTVFLKMSPTMLQFASPWGKLTYDGFGLRAVTSSGAKFSMGGISVDALPSALGASSFIRLQASMVKVNGNIVHLGKGPAYQAVPYSLIGTPPVVSFTNIVNLSSSVWVSVDI